MIAIQAKNLQLTQHGHGSGDVIAQIERYHASAIAYALRDDPCEAVVAKKKLHEMA